MQDAGIGLRRLSARDTLAGDPGGSIVGISTYELPDGAICWCAQTQCDYQLRRSATTAADGLYVLAPAAGPGRWFQVMQPGSSVLTQAAWYVNATTGNDANSGASADQALLTLAELYRRTQGRVLLADATIYLSGNFSTQQLALSCLCAPGVNLDIRGDMTVSVANGSIDAFAAYNGGASTPAALTDAPVDFSVLVYQYIRMTSGAAVGMSAPILKNVAAGQCRPGLFMESGGTGTVPGVGDTYVVEDFGTTIGGVDFSGVVGNGGDGNLFIPRILLRDVYVFSPGQDLVFGTGTNIGVYVYRVKFGDGTWPSNITNSVVNLVGCLNVDMITIDQTATVYLFGHADAGYLNVLGGHVFNANIGGGGLIHQGPYGGLTVGFGSFVTVAQDAYFDSENGSVLTVEQGGFYSASQAAALIWGANNGVATYGIRCWSGSILEYVTTPTVTGVNNTIVGGTVKAYGAIPYFEVANGAGIVGRA